MEARNHFHRVGGLESYLQGWRLGIIFTGWEARNHIHRVGGQETYLQGGGVQFIRREHINFKKNNIEKIFLDLI